MKYYRLLLAFIVALFISEISFGQTDTLFWFAVPYVSDEHVADLQADLTLTATDKVKPTNVTISQPHDPNFAPINLTIDPTVGATENVHFDETDIRRFSNSHYNVKENSALLIQADRDITAYYEMHRPQNNPDIFSLKGNNALGTEFWVPFQEYWPNQTAYDTAFSQICVVATENNTQIEVNFLRPAEGFGVGTHLINLDRGETFMFVPQHDIDGFPGQDPGDRLVGTHISVLNNKPIAVTTGDDSVEKGGWDYIGDQLVPVVNFEGQNTIGEEYIVMKGKVNDNNGNEKVYILATQPNTTIDVDIKGKASYPVNIPNAGGQAEIDLIQLDNDHYVHLDSDKPIYVYHIAGFGTELGGAVVPTIDGCTGSLSVSFVRSKSEPFYLNLMTTQEAIDSFFISQNNGPALPFLDVSDFEQVGSTDFYVLKDASKFFPDDPITLGGIPTGANIRIFNKKGVFHLGTINGVVSGGGCIYGYFSDYIDNRGEAEIVASGGALLSRCYGDTIELKASGGISYSWSPAKYLNNPDTSHPRGLFPPSYPDSTYDYAVTISRPCYGDTVMHVLFEIYPNVTADFSIDNAVGCAPHEIRIVNNSEGANEFSWDYRDDRSYDSNTTDSIHYHAYSNIGSTDSIYTLKLRAENDTTSCIDFKEREVRVFPEINAGFAQSGTVGCNPFSVSFSDTSTGHLDKYDWTFGDGASSSQPSPDHEYINPTSADTSYTAQLVTTSPYFCRDTARKDILVHSFLEAKFTIHTTKGCSPFAIDINHNSKGGVDTAFWNFNGTSGFSFSDTTYDKTIAPPLIYVHDTASIYTDTVEIELIVNNGNCTDTLRDSVFVYPEVIADFLPPDSASCNPMEVKFRNYSSFAGIADTLGLTYDWDFGDGGNSESYQPMHLFENINPYDTSYTALLTVTNPQGCWDTASSVITVSPYIKADFKVDEGSGCAPHTVTITNTSKGGINSYEWDFGDGTSIRTDSKDTLMHTYTNITATVNTHILHLVVENEDNCTDTLTRVIKVYPSVNADFDILDMTGCNPDSVNFDNHSAYIGTSDTSNLSYSWDFGDGSSSNKHEHPHTFFNQGDTTAFFPVELIVTGPYTCSDTLVDTLTVNRYVEADFTVERADSCSPFNVRIENHSSGGIYDWYWDVDNFSSFPSIDSTTTNQGSFMHRYVNTTGKDSLVMLTLIARNASGCSDTTQRQIRIYPEVTAAFQPDNGIDCDPYDLIPQNLSSYTNGDTLGLSYNWDFGDGGTSNQFEPPHRYENTTDATITYPTKLKVISPNGCKDSITHPVEVYRYVEADFTVARVDSCSPFHVRIENHSRGGSYDWFWDDDDLSTPDTSGFPSGFTKIYRNTSGTDSIVHLTLIASNASGCSDTLQKQIIIYTEVTAEFDPKDAIDCNPHPVLFDNLSRHTGTADDTTGLIYSWDFGDGGTSAKFEPMNVFENIQSTTADYYVNLQVKSPHGCTDEFEDTVQVYPYVEPSFTVERADSCSPFNVRVTNHSSGGIYYWNWFYTGPGAPDLETHNRGNLYHQYVNQTGIILNHEITLIAGTDTGGGAIGCTDTMRKIITVYPEVTADYQPLDTIDCNMFELPFDNRSAYTSTSDHSDLTYRWDFGDGLHSKKYEPFHNFVNPDDTVKDFLTELRVYSPYNCTDTITDTVQVEPFIEADFEINRNKGCSPLDISITNDSKGGITDYYWFWNDDNLNLSAADSDTKDAGFIHTYTNTSGSPQIQLLTLIVSNGNCYDTVKQQITVYSSLNAHFTQDTIRGCNPLMVNFESRNSTSTSYSWQFGDGATSNLQHPIHEFENPSVHDKVYTVKYIPETRYGCTDTAYQDIYVHSKLQADYKVKEDQGCPPFNVAFENTAVGNPANTYQWSIDGNPVSGAPTNKSLFMHTFTNADPVVKEFEVELLAENPHGCQSTYRDTITVYHDVDADFDMDRIAGCNPLSIEFSNEANVPAGTGYSWSFGDGATSALPDPKHTFFNYDRATDITYTIGLEVISPYECRHDTSKTIKVYHQPKAKFEIDTTTSCPPLVATMTDRSIGHDSLQWRFGDGNFNASDHTVSHSYPNTTNNVKPYALELYVETGRGCRDSTNLVLNVYPEVEARFGIDQPEACAPLVTGFINTSRNADFYSWQFGDGGTSSQKEPIYQFTNTSDADTTYHITLISSSAFECVDTIVDSVRVNAQPIAEFNILEGYELQRWPESRVFFQDWSNEGPWRYTWDFGDGKQSNNAERTFHDYDHWNTMGEEYTISLELNSKTSSCWDTISRDIRILPPLIHPGFKMVNSKGCEPLEVRFAGDKSPFDEKYQYDWDFGDGSTGKGRIISHQYDSAGTYYVKMQAGAEGGEAITYDTVVVYKRPVVNFDVDPTLVMLPDQKINCYNFTNHATRYEWDFGDGSKTSNMEAPSHQYSNLGVYTVTLSAWSDKGCLDVDSLPEIVEVQGKGYIKFPNAFTPSESGPSKGYWDPEATDNDIFHPVGEGIKEYQLEIYNKWGERLFISHDFRVGWDGYYKGEMMKQDVYIWKVEGKFYNGKSFEDMGDVTLLRNFPNGNGD